MTLSLTIILFGSIRTTLGDDEVHYGNNAPKQALTADNLKRKFLTRHATHRHLYEWCLALEKRLFGD